MIGAVTNTAQTATAITQQPREATPGEFDIWIRAVDEYDQRLRPAVWYALKVAEVAASLQSVCDRFGLPSVWSAVDQARIDDLLNRYNTIGRIIEGVWAKKYYITIEGGDVTVSAPAKMTREEYSADIYPGAQSEKSLETGPEYQGLGNPLVIVIVIAAALVIVASLYATIKLVEYIADMFAKDVQKKLAQLDAQMSTQPKQVFDNYLAAKKASTEQIKEAAKAAPKEEEGWWDSFTGTAKKFVGAVGIGLLIWLALTAFGKVRRETASTKEG